MPEIGRVNSVRAAVIERFWAVGISRVCPTKPPKHTVVSISEAKADYFVVPGGGEMEIEAMTRSLFACRFAAGFSVCFAGPLAAAPLPTPDAVAQAEPSSASVSGLTPAKACLSDLSAFDSQMEKEGYWPGGAGFGYGYPMDGYPANSPNDYRNVRPSYELRTLIAAANILAQRGQQQACEDTLSTIREIYKTRSADMRANGNPEMNGPSRQQLEIAAAQPVTAQTNPFLSDQLVGTDVRNAKNENLGSVHDIVDEPVEWGYRLRRDRAGRRFRDR